MPRLDTPLPFPRPFRLDPVVDNGSCIPFGQPTSDPTKSTVEVVLTVLHAGGKFGGGAYAVSGGLHGVGSSVVNALSTRFDVEVRQKGYVWRHRFANGGEPQQGLDRKSPRLNSSH